MAFNWDELHNTLHIVEELRNTGSSKLKNFILSSMIGEEMLQQVLLYTYDQFKRYGISDKVYEDIPYSIHKELPKIDSPFDLFDELARSNINDSLREITKAYIEIQVPEKYRDLIKGILFKDLRIGMASKSINKVYKGLIPEFNVQLAESFAKKPVPEGAEFFLTTKLDGFRVLAVPDEEGIYKFYTRKGEIYEGIDFMENDCQLIGLGKFVLDGELIARNDDNLSSGDLYKLTTKIARKKGESLDKFKLQFHCFDMLPVEEFKRGCSTFTYKERRSLLESRFELHKDSVMDLIKVDVLYQGTDQSVIPVITKEVIEKGLEGVMINLSDSLYECKRHAGILKVKEFKDADVYVKGVYEGTGRNKGRLGGVIIQYLHNGEVCECECGSGFTDAHRNEFWANPDLIVGRVIEIQYFEVTTNKKGGFGLRFPSWHYRFRDDKTIDDITDVALQ